MAKPHGQRSLQRVGHDRENKLKLLLSAGLYARYPGLRLGQRAKDKEVGSPTRRDS